MPVEGQVDLWLCDLDDLDRVELQRHAVLLDEGEIVRWQRYVRQEDRDRFLAGRALTRRVLAECLGVPPAALAFSAGPQGRPCLAAPATADGATGNMNPLHFNLSHSGAIVALALACEPGVGVDVEAMHRATDIHGIAQSVFTSSEQALLAAGPELEQQPCFFRLWTLKEAYSKALGMGFAMDFQSFAVALESHDRARLVLAADEEAQAWTLLCPPVRAGYALGLAVRSCGRPVDLRGPFDGSALLRRSLGADP